MCTFDKRHGAERVLQLKELMVDHINATHKNEDYTPRYLMTEQLDTKEPALHMFETYALSSFTMPYAPFD